MLIETVFLRSTILLIVAVGVALLVSNGIILATTVMRRRRANR